MTIKKNQIEATQILTGSGVPNNANGTDGDLYIRSNGDYYSKAAGVWGSPLGNLTGPQGAQGAAGTNGTNGTNGSQILTGAGVPSNASGNNGDIYIRNNATGDYYVKSGGVWVFQFGLVGAQGPAGANGTNGIFSAIASQSEAEAGTENTKGMTPLRTAQAIAALGGGGGGDVTEYRRFLTNNVTIFASGTTAELDAISVSKDFSVAGVSRLIVTNGSGARIISVDVTFTSGETTGRTDIRFDIPEPNAETDMAKSARPLAIRFTSVYGVGATTSSITNSSGTLQITVSGFTGGIEQKARIMF